MMRFVISAFLGASVFFSFALQSMHLTISRKHSNLSRMIQLEDVAWNRCEEIQVACRDFPEIALSAPEWSDDFMGKLQMLALHEAQSVLHELCSLLQDNDQSESQASLLGGAQQSEILTEDSFVILDEKTQRKLISELFDLYLSMHNNHWQSAALLHTWMTYPQLLGSGYDQELSRIMVSWAKLKAHEIYVKRLRDSACRCVIV